MTPKATYTNLIFDRVHRTGEEIKNDLPNLLERAIDREAWKEVINPSTNEPYASVGEWLVARWPLGPGVGHGRFAIDYDDCIQLCKDRPALKDLLVKHRPKRKNGVNRKPDEAVDNVNSLADRKTGNSRLYIEERLQRDHSEIWQAYLRGEYRSARQAGIAAGFVKDGHKKPSPLQMLLKSWEHATAAEREAFLAAIKKTTSGN